MNHLPPEIQNHITLFLELKDTESLSRTCKSFSFLFEEAFRREKKIESVEEKNLQLRTQIIKRNSYYYKTFSRLVYKVFLASVSGVWIWMAYRIYLSSMDGRPALVIYDPSSTVLRDLFFTCILIVWFVGPCYILDPHARQETFRAGKDLIDKISDSQCKSSIQNLEELRSELEKKVNALFNTRNQQLRDGVSIGTSKKTLDDLVFLGKKWSPFKSLDNT